MIDIFPQNIKRIALSGPLYEINFYQVNDNFFELPEEGYWLIDGGVELKFPSGIISAAWNSKLEFFVLQNDVVENIYGQDNLLQIETENISKLNRFVGLKVVETNFKSLEFEYIADYTMRIEKEQRFVELILEFQNKSQIQIAFVDYVLEENSAPKDFSFDIGTDLLISTKNIMNILSE